MRLLFTCRGNYVPPAAQRMDGDKTLEVNFHFFFNSCGWISIIICFFSICLYVCMGYYCYCCCCHHWHYFCVCSFWSFFVLFSSILFDKLFRYLSFFLRMPERRLQWQQQQSMKLICGERPDSARLITRKMGNGKLVPKDVKKSLSFI